MRSSARYRFAIRALPARVRREHGDDILATLADLEREPGHAWPREVLSLLGAGLRLRAEAIWTALTPRRLAVCASMLAVLTALAPATIWAERLSPARRAHGYAMLDGPTPALRWLLLAAAALTLTVALGGRSVRRVTALATAASAVDLVQGVGAILHRAGAHPVTRGDLGNLIPRALLLGVVVFLAGIALNRLPAIVGVRVAAGALTVTCVTAVTAAARADPPSALGSLALWQLRPAGLLGIVAIALTALALIASQRFHHEASAPAL